MAVIWLLPALLFNIDWTGHGSWQANTAAIFMIIGSAVFIEGARLARSWLLSPVLVLAALFMVYGNAKVAFETLSVASEGRSEARRAEMSGASQVASQASLLKTARAVQVQLASETAVETFRAQLQQIKMREPRRWQATSGCEAEKVTTSAAFCAEVASVQSKLSAAHKRDEIDAQLRALDSKVEGVVVPEVEDVYVANVAAFLTAGGVQMTPEVQRLIAAEKAISRAIGFELLATLGPTCWLLFIEGLLGLGTHASRAASRVSNIGSQPRRERAVPSPRTSPKETTVLYERFVADELEEAAAGESMRSSDLRTKCQAWCEARGEAFVEKAFWDFLRSRFTHDANNGRPRYLGVRPKRATPTLTLVQTAA